MSDQTGWLPEPDYDRTPIETGGAIVTVRLTPAEVAALTKNGRSLWEAIHEAVMLLLDPADTEGP